MLGASWFQLIFIEDGWLNHGNQCETAVVWCLFLPPASSLSDLVFLAAQRCLEVEKFYRKHPLFSPRKPWFPADCSRKPTQWYTPNLRFLPVCPRCCIFCRSHFPCRFLAPCLHKLPQINMINMTTLPDRGFRKKYFPHLSTKNLRTVMEVSLLNARQAPPSSQWMLIRRGAHMGAGSYLANLLSLRTSKLQGEAHKR